MPEQVKTKAEVIDAIREFFEDEIAVYISCIEDLGSYNGWLGDDRIYYMEELDELYADVEPTEILRRAFYGYDAETWHTDSHGEKEYGEFNPNREFYYYNGYGNFVSCDYKDYSDYLTEETIEAMLEYRNEIYAIKASEELSKLFDELESAEEE